MRNETGRAVGYLLCRPQAYSEGGSHPSRRTSLHQRLESSPSGPGVMLWSRLVPHWPMRIEPRQRLPGGASGARVILAVLAKNEPRFAPCHSPAAQATPAAKRSGRYKNAAGFDVDRSHVTHGEVLRRETSAP